MKFFFSRYFIFLALFILLLIAIPFFFYASSQKVGVVGGLIPSTILPPIFRQALPTPIPSPVLQISDVSPSDKTTNVALNEPISITFSRRLNQEERRFVRLAITPDASGSATWSPDNTQLVFVPTALFSPQTSYSATIIVNNNPLTWSFATAALPSSTAQAQQGRNIQASYDEQWGQIQQAVYQNYPWFDQLPISTPDYFVSFDTQQNILYADLFPKDPNDTTEIDRIKQEVTKALLSIHVDLNKTNVQWTIQ